MSLAVPGFEPIYLQTRGGPFTKLRSSQLTSFAESLAEPLDGVDLSSVQKLSSREKNLAEQAFEPGAAGWEAKMLPLCFATAPFTCFGRQITYLFSDRGHEVAFCFLAAESYRLHDIEADSFVPNQIRKSWRRAPSKSS